MLFRSIGDADQSRELGANNQRPREFHSFTTAESSVYTTELQASADNVPRLLSLNPKKGEVEGVQELPKKSDRRDGEPLMSQGGWPACHILNRWFSATASAEKVYVWIRSSRRGGPDIALDVWVTKEQEVRTCNSPPTEATPEMGKCHPSASCLA